MSDLSRAKSVHRPDADGTRIEDDRQLTELLLQNKVNLRPEAAQTSGRGGITPLMSRVKAGLILFVALPSLLFAYFSSRIEEDDFYA